MAEPLRAVIAEDNYLVREGLRRLLEDSGEVEVLACVGSATTSPASESHHFRSEMSALSKSLGK